MSPTNNKRKKTNYNHKPILIKCGSNYINPLDIQRILHIKKGNKDLYCVKFISDPNPTFACWVKGEDIEVLLEHFNIILSDERE